MKRILMMIYGICAINCANVRGGVTGTVIDGAAIPVANAHVDIYDTNKEKNVYSIDTATNGRFEYYEDNFVIFNGYCGPSLIVTVTKEGYQKVEKKLSWLCKLERYNPVLK